MLRALNRPGRAWTVVEKASRQDLPRPKTTSDSISLRCLYEPSVVCAFQNLTDSLGISIEDRYTLDHRDVGHTGRLGRSPRSRGSLRPSRSWRWRRPNRACIYLVADEFGMELRVLLKATTAGLVVRCSQPQAAKAFPYTRNIAAVMIYTKQMGRGWWA